MNRFSSLNEVQIAVLREILRSGHEASPRSRLTKEIMFFNFTLEKPRSRILSLEGRQWNLAVAIGELCWHLAESDSSDFISYYARAWSELATADCKIAGSSYGKTIFSRDGGGISQWDGVAALLNADADSRRAILFFNTSHQRLLPSTPDVACASSLQFILRNGLLDAVISMRSNDVIFGLPYDVFIFTMLQEIMAAQLGVGLGEYHHSVSSLHLYERHFNLAKRMLNGGDFVDYEMPALTGVDCIPGFLEAEHHIRSGAAASATAILDPYWADLVNVLRWHRSWVEGGKAVGSVDEIDFEGYRAVLGKIIRKGGGVSSE